MNNPFKNKRSKSSVGIVVGDAGEGSICVKGYTSLADNPEIMTACRKIAELIGSITIYLMNNTAQGDVRITNELSRKVDINPMPNMTRSHWMQGIVMNLLLYGRGNSIVVPVTRQGYLEKLEPISASRVNFQPIGYSDYQVSIDGRTYSPDELLHFTMNPDRTYMWKGRGVTANLVDLANNLKQAQATTKGFLESKWKPSVIVKVDALIDEFSNATGRKKLMDEYVKSSEAGEPWLIPADQFDVEQVRPLSLADLAINDTVQLDRRLVASIIGVPAFLLGVGEYNKDEWNGFVSTTIKTIVTGLQQEMTKKLIISPDWYWRFNVLSLMDWDLQTIASVFGGLSDKGFITGNEVRDRIGMSPMEGLDELRVLENYIPVTMTGMQSKLIQEGGQDEE